ncbi:hypothetical protein DN069_01095 [Streptacidiphilus pinicola]|uniref:DUF3592 domain-containing protein n=1 Tax=Streptacidiphilus pinicola TaxID=2219663 RepID=A0A2X0IQG7_9ACTN|nr:hypothetical protein [Streptacidiphilus pinicola]RAG87462.1 hypothetical protein DN069_01095 [Streptacidiphilus pinicola]
MKDRDIDPEADARAWREADLPELTPEQEQALKLAGFETKKLRHLAAGGRYGRSLAISVLICFTDAYPQAAAVQDIARAGEANRMITSRSADEFEAVLQLRGLHSRRGPGGDPKVRKAKARLTATPATGVRWWSAWVLVVVPTLLLTSGLAAMDVGVGVVFGIIWLIIGWVLVVRRLAYRRAPTGHLVGQLYVMASICFVVAGMGASNAALLALGQQGVGSVDSQSEGVGGHGTHYFQCTVRQPDGAYVDLRSTGACPGPVGTPVTIVYVSGGQVLRPALGTASSLMPWAGLWGLGTLGGCGLLAGAAVRGRRG